MMYIIILNLVLPSIADSVNAMERCTIDILKDTLRHNLKEWTRCFPDLLSTMQIQPYVVYIKLYHNSITQFHVDPESSALF
ncbi:hypothetical protein BDF14DRAFT_1803158 [Spinellus fusiger]|nr:hypothetical protein BDF14DRAFT_1803158 [Spinellus fusiger]